jgi:16S rRNA (adenine1518-N6/adenine1519-N6)-dimethyltransferase
LLEIGPGKGAITNLLIELLEKDPGPIRRFTLSERDILLSNEWRERKGPAGLEFRIEEGDFLDLDEARFLPQDKSPLAVVSNLPYSAGTAILTRLARHFDQIPVMVLMFQAEVAQRLRAEPSTKAWGSLSVWIQNRWDVQKLLTAPPGAFSPPPDVQSEVVVLRRRSSPQVGWEGHQAEHAWEQLLKSCFAHRRKMLRSGLPRSGPLRNALETSGVDGTKRAESLSWEEWQRLMTALLASKSQ